MRRLAICAGGLFPGWGYLDAHIRTFLILMHFSHPHVGAHRVVICAGGPGLGIPFEAHIIGLQHMLPTNSMSCLHLPCDHTPAQWQAHLHGMGHHTPWSDHLPLRIVEVSIIYFLQNGAVGTWFMGSLTINHAWGHMPAVHSMYSGLKMGPGHAT